MPNEWAILLHALGRCFQSGDQQLWAVRDVFLRVAHGEALAITGPSGSGKTTLLNLIAGLDRPTVGEVWVLGERLDVLPEAHVTAFRARSVGLVFQDPHLLPGFTALENVVIGRLPWHPRRQLEREATALLTAVGMGHRLDYPLARLSAGERQRVGIARALLGHPPLLLADEPTGNLDANTTEDVLALLRELRREFGLTPVVVTHDPAVAAVASRVIRLVGGHIQSEQTFSDDASVDVHTLE